MTFEEENSRVDVAVVGVGQAGLAAGQALTGTKLTFVLLERDSKIGESWRNRHASLRLFSPRALSSLPGLPLAGDSDGYPAKDEIAAYLDSYARHFRLPVKVRQKVTSLRREGDMFHLRTQTGAEWSARSVIIAAGAFQVSVRPSFADSLPSEVLQLDASTYRSPSEVPQGHVLVVGGGATGRQIARELSKTHETWLSCGRRVSISRQRLLGRDVMWWTQVTGFLTADKGSFRGRMARRYDSFPGLELTDASLRLVGVRVAGRSISAAGPEVHFLGGERQSFRTVIWCVGYRDETSWIHIDEALADGAAIEQRGVSPVPGLFYLGRSWQTCRASALICGAGKDASTIVSCVCDYLSKAEMRERREARGRSRAQGFA